MTILLIDSYDSFTFNLKRLIQKSTGAEVVTIHNDAFDITSPKELEDFDNFISHFEAIVIGPGPGSPQNAQDIGVIAHVLTKKDIPILGICLGFQCLCDAHGAEILYADEVVHGQVYDVERVHESEIFNEMPQSFKSVRYHSICVQLNLEKNSTIVPLAYTQHQSKRILMAAQHEQYPHYGVQYHPESICSEQGSQLIRNFWSIACKHNNEFHRSANPSNGAALSNDAHAIKATPLLSQSTDRRSCQLNYGKVSIPGVSVIDICDYFESVKQDFLLLNSAAYSGKWSIIGLPFTGETDVITHSTQNPKEVKVSKWNSSIADSDNSTSHHCETLWTFLAKYLQPKLFNTKDDPEVERFPFVGGLVGLISYEEGEFVQPFKLNDITSDPIPDTKLCLIEKFLLHDLVNDDYYVASIANKDTWIDDTVKELQTLKPSSTSIDHTSVQQLLSEDEIIDIEMPDREKYIDSFEACQKYLKDGNSYELCLTVPTKIRIPQRISSWDMYKILTKRNPSPYSCFMKFSDCELLSSSPEKFISWDSKSCQLRPIKGTVKKTPDMTFEKAEALLKTPKEMGENLMIVDLIRHDLYTFLSQVDVSQLMTVEEYKTVYQLVSVINGSFEDSPYSGLDILSTSLPPGSMTGAPKKRSVEILQELESSNRRGIYSGVCGYLSLNNKSDWSVVIRSCFKYTNDLESTVDTSIWRIGAGGAITILSDAEGEWEEMKLKLESALQAFQ